MGKIVTVTMNPAIDKSSSLDRVIAEKKLRCSVPTFDPGGGGINVSRVVQRLGGESLAIYPAGGLNGQKLSWLIAGEGFFIWPGLTVGYAF
jgi:6-phosphofructokinase 2